MLCRHIGLDTQWNVGIISGNRKHNSNVSRLNHFRITLRFTAVNRIAVIRVVKRNNTDRFYEVPSSTDSPIFGDAYHSNASHAYIAKDRQLIINWLIVIGISNSMILFRRLISGLVFVCTLSCAKMDTKW